METCTCVGLADSDTEPISAELIAKAKKVELKTKMKMHRPSIPKWISSYVHP